MWKQLFQATWKTFKTKFSCLLENLHRHRRLVESQANLAQFEELFQELQRARINSEAEFQSLKDGEKSHQLNTVQTWLSAASTNVDQETYASKRKKYPTSGRWLLGDSRMRAWLDPEACATPLLWVNGIPGAGSVSFTPRTFHVRVCESCLLTCGIKMQESRSLRLSSLKNH